MGLYVNNVWQESGFEPLVHISGCPGSNGAIVSNLTFDDNLTSFASVRVDNVR